MEQAFQIINLVIPGLILALYAARYQLRKKVEIRIETQLAKLRIQAYETIHASFVKLMHTQTPSLQLQSDIKHIMSHYGFCDLGIDYPAVMATEHSFDTFYHEVMETIADHSILLDYDTHCQAQNSLAILSQLKTFLDAFSDAERTHRVGESLSEDVQRKIDYAYLLAGIALKNDCNRAFLTLEDELSHQISHISIVPSRRYLKRMVKAVRDALCYVALLGSKLRHRTLSMLSERVMFRLLGRSRRLFTAQASQFVLLLEYVHVSDRYSFQQYLSLTPEERGDIAINFWPKMQMQMHTMNLGMMR